MRYSYRVARDGRQEKCYSLQGTGGGKTRTKAETSLPNKNVRAVGVSWDAFLFRDHCWIALFSLDLKFIFNL
jgi:hypothetical protein